MSEQLIKSLFTSDIYRRIEEVIKVDQAREEIIYEEISEYVATDAIKRYFTDILERYHETPNKPHEGTAIWVSGFFGSGKSSFAKILGVILANRKIVETHAADLFAKRTGDIKINVLLKNITENIPTEAVIFDVSTDRGIRSGNQTLTEIMYRLFLQHLGYARDLDLSELEITLEAENKLEQFKNAYTELFNKDWDQEKGKVAFAISQASKVMHHLHPDTYSAPDSWVKATRNRAEITPSLLAKRCKELMARRRAGKNLVFVIDEVGQFVARDVQKMLDLQAVVQNLGRVGRGKMWIVVTSQEKLNELVGGLDDKREEPARLMDRFPLQVHLEPSDISEVTNKRLLSKNAAARKTLRELFTRHRGRLTQNSKMSADIKLPELTTESFVDLYPLMPFHVDLIIQAVSGLRNQEGASKHVGGANRTIIKLAQQLLIHPNVNLAEQSIGKIATIDQIYTLVSGNISGEIRGKIDAIKTQVDHPLAQKAAQSICLLQFVKSIHRTAENVSASLHPCVDADSSLSQVKAALDALVKAHKIRLGDDGYRIPSPAEDDWERQRASLSPKPGDAIRIHTQVINRFWQPQPSCNFQNAKLFKAGLFFNGKMAVDGDIPVHLVLAETGREFDERVLEMRSRSQTENKSVFWISAVDETVDRETIELFRSQEILTSKERSTQTRDETALVAEEKVRLRRHQSALKTQIKQALLTGTVFFRGNDRSPDDSAVDAGRTAGRILSQALPEVFDRFYEAAARVKKSDLEALLTTENLRGLPAVFASLKLIKDQDGKPVFDVDQGPLAEVMSAIENRTSYGENATGRYLIGAFAKEPFGWAFDVVRLFIVSLLRAGRIESTSKGQVIESALSPEARNTFLNNNLFRQSSFRPKIAVEFASLLTAVDNFKNVFGHEIPEIEQTVVADAIKKEVGKHQEELLEVHKTLNEHKMPGAEILQDAINQMRVIRNGAEENAILTFNTSFSEIKEAVKRAVEINKTLTKPHIHVFDRSRIIFHAKWPVLEQETGLDETFFDHAEQLKELMQRETFFREFPSIDQHCHALEDEYQRRFKQAALVRTTEYGNALEILKSTPGWEQLIENQQEFVSKVLSKRLACKPNRSTSILLMRADVEACPIRLDKAIEKMMVIIGGQRVAKVDASTFFKGAVETEEQLNAALEGLKEACERLIGEGKKVLVQ